MEPEQVVLAAMRRLTIPGTAALDAPVHMIAEKAEVSPAVARRALRRMQQAGVVRIEERYGRTGARLSNRYTVLG